MRLIRRASYCLLLSPVLFLARPLQCQDSVAYHFDAITVTAVRTPVAFSETGRSVLIIPAEELQTQPASSVQELLATISGLDMRQRGAFGVQSDVSLRGTTFEQTLIMLDGVRLNDPQTGHHIMDLPINLIDIDRIEILKGPASRLYGPNAFAGVIHIISKTAEKARMKFNSSGGSYGYRSGLASVALPIGNTQHLLTVAKQRSDAYRDNTEFDMDHVYFKTGYALQHLSVSLQTGYVDKKFGAYKFYSDAFPNEWEHTTAWFANLTANMSHHTFHSTLKAWWRRHDDDFILDRLRPDWYRNRHTNYTRGINWNSQYHSSFGVTTVGLDMALESITSSNLGNHQRWRQGIYAEQFVSLADRLTAAGGFSIYRTPGSALQWNPGLDINFQLKRNLNLFGSIGRSYREPSFTELYYHSPANIGNPNLAAEQAWTTEAGFKWMASFAMLSVSTFQNRGYRLIDWLRRTSGDPWQVRNLSRTVTNGLDISTQLQPSKYVPYLSIEHVRIGYTWLSMNKSAGDWESKAVLNYLQHQVNVSLQHSSCFGLQHTWSIRYEDRVNDESYVVVDTRISRQIGRWMPTVTIQNIFNKQYYELAYIPAPGRWIMAGINLTI